VTISSLDQSWVRSLNAKSHNGDEPNRFGHTFHNTQ
jgi:hypothetical protein